MKKKKQLSEMDGEEERNTSSQILYNTNIFLDRLVFLKL